ncbi:MAG: ThuA domain-containing protein [Phycisphaerae bacterium]|nr:ThuA domain-containing protein [Phycisphaerae bacterium]
MTSLLTAAAVMLVCLLQPQDWPPPRDRAPGQPVRAIYCTATAGYRHDVIPESVRIMRAIGERTAWLDIEVTDRAEDLTSERMANADALIFYTTGAIKVDPEHLQRWVRGGGALIGIHCATDTLATSNVYVGLIGGEFDGHPWNERVRIRVDRPGIPAADAWPTTDGGFWIEDEIYQFKRLNPDMTVLLSLAPGQAKMEPGRPYPLAWTRQVGKGRVFYTALGHRPEVWRSEAFQRHVIEGIRWAVRSEPAPTPPASTSTPAHSPDTPR